MRRIQTSTAPRSRRKDQQYGVHQRRGSLKPCNRDRSGNRGRARGTDDQQGDFPAGRYRKRRADLYLYDSEQRQYRGDSGRQCDGQRPLQSDSIQFGSQLERHAADCGDRLTTTRLRESSPSRRAESPYRPRPIRRTLRPVRGQQNRASAP